MYHAIANAKPLIHQRFDIASARFCLADDNIDVMLFKPLQPLSELRRPEIEQLPIDPRPAITQPSRSGDDFFVETLATAYDWTQDHHLFTAIRAADAIEDLAATERPNL